MRRILVGMIVLTVAATGPGVVVAAEEEAGGQSAESAANDATASLWTYQLAWENRTWRDDTLDNGMTRPEGNRDMWQLRFVAPVPLGKNLKMLNRLTLRNNEAVDRSSGAGTAEYFALFLPVEWATGRWGIGPQVNIPASAPQFGSTEWQYGFATAFLQRAAKEKILTGLLVQQVWSEMTNSGSDALVAQPITIQPVFNYSLPKSTYINIGETALSYDWQSSSWLVPLGVRFGKLWIKEGGSTLNLYGEYRTTVIYDDWPGSAIKNAFRINVSYAMPM